MDKKILRKTILQKRDMLTEEQRYEKSQMITKHVLACGELKKAEKVLLYVSYRSEVDTTALLKGVIGMGKQVYVPRVEGTELEFYQIHSDSELEVGYKGIREPKADASKRFRLEEGDSILIIVPGAVFDKRGNRIGYGGGFYDRYLSRIQNSLLNINEDPEKNGASKTRIWTVALAFSCQIVQEEMVFMESHDIQINDIITEEY